MNRRLPDYKKVFSKELFTEYFAEFKPNYILMLITSAIYVALLINFKIIGENTRLVIIKPIGKRYEDLCEAVLW